MLNALFADGVIGATLALLALGVYDVINKDKPDNLE